MLIHASERINKFMEFLNSKVLTGKPCEVVLLPEHDTVEAQNDFGFACYKWDESVIYVAGNLQPLVDAGDISESDIDRVLFESLAHEYIHHVQYVQGENPDEKEAEYFAKKWAEEYFA